MSFDARFHDTVWRMQRFAWVVIALIVIAALLGFMGGGPLTEAHRASRSIQIKYPRYIRSSEIFRIESRISGSVLKLDRAYCRRFEIRKLDPQPASVSIAAGDELFYFKRGADPTIDIVIYLQAPELDFGWAVGAIGTAEDRIEFRQLVWP